jgi:ligand-binding sensor domain-containing protein
MNKLLSLLFCLLTFSNASAQMGNFFPSDRFSSSLIADLCQDKYGYIWIATDYGLNRYDGYHFETFLHNEESPTSICNSVVVSLLLDKEGRLWVGTNRGLDRYDEAIDGFVHYPFPNGILPRVSSMLQLPDGQILVATSGYGAFLVGEDGQPKQTNDLPTRITTSILAKFT